MLTPVQEKLKEAALALQAARHEKDKAKFLRAAENYENWATTDAILAILAQLEQVQGDAERYQWLRQKSQMHYTCFRDFTAGWNGSFKQRDGKELDREIDAAKAAPSLPPPPEAA